MSQSRIAQLCALIDAANPEYSTPGEGLKVYHDCKRALNAARMVNPARRLSIIRTALTRYSVVVTLAHETLQTRVHVPRTGAEMILGKAI